jgi:hypothetical protein
MTKINEIPEKQKALIRKAIFGSSVMFIGLSLFGFLNPDALSQITDGDNDIAKILSGVFGLVGIIDFALAFILFRSKERV